MQCILGSSPFSRRHDKERNHSLRSCRKKSWSKKCLYGVYTSGQNVSHFILRGFFCADPFRAFVFMSFLFGGGLQRATRPPPLLLLSAESDAWRDESRSSSPLAESAVQLAQASGPSAAPPACIRVTGILPLPSICHRNVRAIRSILRTSSQNGLHIRLAFM